MPNQNFINTQSKSLIKDRREMNLNSYFFVWEPELLEMLAEDLGVSVPVVEVVSRLEL